MNETKYDSKIWWKFTGIGSISWSVVSFYGSSSNVTPASKEQKFV